MSLNKKKMVREIGRRTRLKNRDVQAVIEALIDVWTEELINGGRIEIEGFCTFRVYEHERFNPRAGRIQHISRVLMQPGKRLKAILQSSDSC